MINGCNATRRMMTGASSMRPRGRFLPQPLCFLGNHTILTRQLRTSDKGDEKSFSGNGNGEAKGTGTRKAPAVTLCQLNNHPDFRLRQAKARLEHNLAKGDAGGANSMKEMPTKSSFKANTPNSKPVRGMGGSMQIQENPARSNDGTSSGALAADRLQKARRKALAMIQSFPAEKSSQINGFLQPDIAPHPTPKTERLIDIQMNENSVQSNDGTSSGAVAADRLRQARRKVLESMKDQMSKPPDASPAKAESDAVQVHENRIMPNDGTSSGAVAADRLRQARRTVLKNMNKQLPTVPSASPETPPSALEEDRAIMHIHENAIRSNDRNSSGAIAADRLRQARRKVLGMMTDKEHPPK